MKKFLILLFLSPLAFFVNAQNAIIKQTITSKILKEDREIWMALPKNYHDSIAQKDSYPVIYLLDPEINFEYLTAITYFMSKQPYAQIPEAIIVGITNTDRTRDFTPSKASIRHPFIENKTLFDNSGHLNNFLLFLKEELKPFIHQHYRTSSYNIIIGHSFGGLATIYCFLKHPEYFNAYVAHDPSIWWDNNLLTRKQKNTQFSQASYNKKILFISAANNPADEKDWIRDHKMAIDSFNLFFNNNPRTFDYKYSYYNDEHHGSISLPANYEALKYIFRGFETNFRKSNENPDKYIIQPYKSLSNRIGSPISPTRSYIQQLMLFALKKNDTASASFFKKMMK